MAKRTPEQEVALRSKIAVLTMAGMSAPKIQAELGLTKAEHTRLCKDPSYMALIEQMQQAENAPALNKAKARMTKLVDKAVDAIERALDSPAHGDSLKAASMVLRSLGLDEQEEQQSDTNITVVLPSGQEAKTINIEGASYEVQDGSREE